MEWDPLGDVKWMIKDLNNYEIEAIDFVTDLQLMDINSKKSCIRLVKIILSQAFDIDVIYTDVEKYGNII